MYFMFEVFLRTMTISIVSKYTRHRDFTHVGDHAASLLLIEFQPIYVTKLKELNVYNK